MSARLCAAKVLQRVLGDGRALDEALDAATSALAPRDRALAAELCYGTLRWHFRIGALIDLLIEKPLRARDLDVECLLRLGLYELMHLRTPDYAAVNEWAGLARRLRKNWAAGLVNGVLRRYRREAEALEAQVDTEPAAACSLPAWLHERLADAYAEQMPELCRAINERPPFTLRVNLARIDRADYVERLGQAGIEARIHAPVPSAVTLTQACDVTELPGFAEGLVSVQDAAAQLAAPLLDCRPGMRVLDACAAPGGKTLHLLETTDGDLDLTALDVDAERLARVRENLDRGGFEARLATGDGTRPQDWHAGGPYDRILLDAPCSATGVLRRHPDIRVLRRACDIPVLAERQRALLDALWPLLVPGGILLYATCSLLPQENDAVIAAFVEDRNDVQAQPIAAAWGRPRGHGRQILTGESGMDGFFYARLAKC